MKAHEILALVTFAVAFLANTANAQVSDQALPKKTICTATINSDDEKVTFQKYLHPDHFQFVELVKNKHDVDFLKRACRNTKIKCDVTLISGHFGGGFTDNKEFFLPLEDIENLSCGGCPNVLGGADVVYLFGCNTLAGKNLDGRSPQEYYQVLVNEVGLEPAEARATVAVRYSAIGDSFNARLRRVLKGSAVVGGFTSKAPLGEQIRPSLAGYFGTLAPGLKQDGVLEEWERHAISLAFYQELNRMKAGASNGQNKALSDAGKRIQKNFGGIIDNGYIDVAGIQPGTTEDFVATRMCSINKSKDKLQVIADIINTGDRSFVIQMLPYLMEISEKGDRMNDKQEAFFNNLSMNSQLRDIIAGQQGIITELDQAPEEQLKTVDLAYNLKWLSADEKAAYYQSAAIYVWNNSNSFLENKSLLKKISAQMQAVQPSQVKDSAFKGKGIFNMIQSLKSNQADWLSLASNKLGIAINYYYNSYMSHAKELETNKNLSEGWKKKHETKMKDAKKSSESICSMLKKNQITKPNAINLISPFSTQFEAMNAKCL